LLRLTGSRRGFKLIGKVNAADVFYGEFLN